MRLVVSLVAIGCAIGCVRIQDQVQYGERTTGTRTRVERAPEQRLRPTRVAWTQGPEGTTAEIGIQGYRACTTVELDSVERVAVHVREERHSHPMMGTVLVLELVGSIAALIGGPILLASADNADQRLGAAAVTGTGALFLAGFIWTWVVAGDPGEQVILRTDRERGRTSGECDLRPAAQVAVTGRIRGTRIAIGTTGADGVLRVDLAELVTPELLASLAEADRLVLAAESGMRLGDLAAAPLVAREEGRAWTEAAQAATREAYEAYLARFPRGAHAEDARRALTQLDEATAWRVAAEQDTASGYQRYLDSHRDGAHAAEARAALAFAVARERDDVEGWRTFLQNHPAHPERARAEARLRELTADDDQDGIANPSDLCVADAETRNEYEDADGCPDASPADLTAAPEASDTMWAPRGELPPDVIAAAADASDPTVLWLVTAAGRVLRLSVPDWRIARAGQLPARVVSLDSLPGRLVATAADGTTWISADGGAWRAASVAGATVREQARCGDRVWLATGAGLFAIGASGTIEAMVERRAFSHVACDEQGGVWAMEDDGTMHHFSADARGRALATLAPPSGLAAEDFARASLAGHGGATWLATRGGRLYRGSGGQWAPAGTGLAAGTQIARLVVIGPDLYLITVSGMLYRWTRDRWMLAESGWEGLTVRSLLTSPSGERWLLGVAGGARLYARGRVAQRQTLAGAVLFESGSAEAAPGLAAAIDEIARAWRPGRRLRIEGHTDSVGSRARNIELSRARAETVRRALIARGVPAWAITTQGYGPLRPVASNANESGRARNRRVEVLWME